MRFFRHGNQVVAEMVSSARKFSLKHWQYELLARFDGKRTYEECAKAVYTQSPGAFTVQGLVNFYRWLYDEDLVVCECASIFELALDDSDEEPDAEERESQKPSGDRLSAFSRLLLHDSKARRIMVAAASIVFCLAVIRVVYVAAPVFEPPAKRLYAEAGRWLGKHGNAVPEAMAERTAESPKVEEMALASRVDEVPVAPKVASVESVQPTESVEQAPSEPSLLDRIEELRTQLEECRIRRDEFYLQNNEEGYRREVHRMTNLTKEIGDIEKLR